MAAERMMNPAEDIYPKRLVMVQSVDNCMFCEHPEGVSYTIYVDSEDKLGIFVVLPASRRWKKR